MTRLAAAVFLLAVPVVATGGEDQAGGGKRLRGRGRLVLDAPAGARVWIDREPQGTRRTFVFSDLPVGRHAKFMTVQFAGGEEARRTFFVETGRTTRERVLGSSRIVLRHSGLPYILDPDRSTRDVLEDDDHFEYRCPLLSPDGSHVALCRRPRIGKRSLSREELRILDRRGGGSRSLGNGNYPVWSPDGTSLAYRRFIRSTPRVMDAEHRSTWLGSHDLYVARADGEGIRLTEGWRPRWSPDGSQILFMRERGDPTRVPWYGLVVTPDGKGIRSLEGKEGAWARWSPDGRQILFLGEQIEGGSMTLYVADATGGAPRRLAAGVNPTWSPDGTLIAFERRRRGGYRSDGQIHVIRPDGTGMRMLTEGYNPSWSPDGRRLAFCRVLAEDQGSVAPSDLYVMRRDGQCVRRLTRFAFKNGTSEVSVLAFCWSPHGNRLAFIHWAGGDNGPWKQGRTSVYVIRADGAGLLLLMNEADGGETRTDTTTGLHWR